MNLTKFLISVTRTHDTGSFSCAVVNLTQKTLICSTWIDYTIFYLEMVNWCVGVVIKCRNDSQFRIQRWNRDIAKSDLHKDISTGAYTMYTPLHHCTKYFIKVWWTLVQKNSCGAFTQSQLHDIALLPYKWV